MNVLRIEINCSKGDNVRADPVLNSLTSGEIVREMFFRPTNFLRIKINSSKGDNVRADSVFNSLTSGEKDDSFFFSRIN